jgi:hypothetical protein
LWCFLLSSVEKSFVALKQALYITAMQSLFECHKTFLNTAEQKTPQTCGKHAANLRQTCVKSVVNPLQNHSDVMSYMNVYWMLCCKGAVTHATP